MREKVAHPDLPPKPAGRAAVLDLLKREGPDCERGHGDTLGVTHGDSPNTLQVSKATFPCEVMKMCCSRRLGEAGRR